MSTGASQVLEDAGVDPLTQQPEPGGRRIESRTPWQLFWRAFRQDKVAVAGLIFIIALIVVAIFAPLIAPYGVAEVVGGGGVLVRVGVGVGAAG